MYCGSFSQSFQKTLQWRHNKRDGVSNHRGLDCLLNRLFRLRWKKTSKPRVTCLCDGNSLGAGGFPSQRTSNTENVSIWWRHREVSHSSPVTKFVLYNHMKLPNVVYQPCSDFNGCRTKLKLKIVILVFELWAISALQSTSNWNVYLATNAD